MCMNVQLQSRAVVAWYTWLPLPPLCQTSNSSHAPGWGWSFEYKIKIKRFKKQFSDMNEWNSSHQNEHREENENKDWYSFESFKCINYIFKKCPVLGAHVNCCIQTLIIAICLKILSLCAKNPDLGYKKSRPWWLLFIQRFSLHLYRPLLWQYLGLVAVNSCHHITAYIVIP